MSADTRPGINPGIPPGDNRIPQTQEFNFLPFAKNEAYRAENRELITQAFIMVPMSFRQVDIATGTGLVPQEIISLCEDTGKRAEIYGIDPDQYVLKLARQETPQSVEANVTYLQGYAQNAANILREKMGIQDDEPLRINWVSIHDAIHEIPGDENKRSVFAFAGANLAPNGVFTLNSAFHNQAMGSAALQYGRWTMAAAELVGERISKTPVEMKSPEDYRAMAEAAGLDILLHTIVQVNLPRKALEDISRYPHFIKGVFPHAKPEDLPKYSTALIQALEKRGVIELPRFWYRMIAMKPQALQ